MTWHGMVWGGATIAVHKHAIGDICPLTFVLGHTEQKIFNIYLSYTQILRFSCFINILSLQNTALYSVRACTVHFAQKLINRYKNFTIIDLYNDSRTDKYKYFSSSPRLSPGNVFVLGISLAAVSKNERQKTSLMKEERLF